MAIESFAGLGPDASPSQGPPEFAYTSVYDYDPVTKVLIYRGWALSSPKPSKVEGWVAQTSAIPATGPTTDLPVWAIQKYTYNADLQITLTQWAGGNPQEVNIWDNRTSLSFQ